MLAYPCKSPSDPTLGNEQWKVVQAGESIAIQSRLPGNYCMQQTAPSSAATASVGDSGTFVFVSMRINTYIRNGAPSNGYALYIGASPNATAPGTWALKFGGSVLASGATPGPILPNVFHALAVEVRRPRLAECAPLCLFLTVFLSPDDLCRLPARM